MGHTQKFFKSIRFTITFIQVSYRYLKTKNVFSDINLPRNKTSSAMNDL